MMLHTNSSTSFLNAVVHLARKCLWPAVAVAFLGGGSPLAGLGPEDVFTEDVETFVTTLRSVPPVSEQIRALVLKSLPTEGRAAGLGKSARRKMSSLSGILDLYGRDSVYDIMVTSVPQASVGLYERTVVLISEQALALLTAAELQALVAHEMGHDFFWQRYRAAEWSRDLAGLQSLELYCDAVAVVALVQAGMDAGNLISALEKLTRFNSLWFGPALNQSRYPSLSGRKRFASRVETWATRNSGKSRRANGPTSGQQNAAVSAALISGEK